MQFLLSSRESKNEGSCTIIPRSKIMVVNDCQNGQNLKVFFQGIEWMDMLTTPMTTTARTFVLQKDQISTFCDNFRKTSLKKKD